MSNLSNLSFKDLDFPHFAEVFKDIEKVFNGMSIEYSIIGASARSIHLLQDDIQPSRRTEDIDFAVNVSDLPHYSALKEALVFNGFTADKSPHRLMHNRTKVIIDLLPFGAIETDNNVILLENEVELSVLGMKEVSHFIVTIVIENVVLKISPLEGIALLKLIAFNEKPQRTKDIDDLIEIISHYYQINVDRFLDAHLDLVDEIPIKDYERLAGARLLGRDMRPILNQSGTLLNKIQAIIEQEFTEETGKMSRYLLRRNERLAYEEISLIFTQLLNGIND